MMGVASGAVAGGGLEEFLTLKKSGAEYDARLVFG